MSQKPALWVPSLFFAEGIPYVVVMTVAVIMYKCLGISNTDIALYTAWLYLPWVIKPFWSPFVDIFGTKRRWILCMQWAIAVSLAAVALTVPADGFFRLTLGCFWLMAFLSATHDIAADGFYMIGLSERNQSLWVGIRTLFYRLAMIAGQGGVVVMAGYISKNHPQAVAWQWSMAVLSGLFALLALWHSFTLPRCSHDHSEGAYRSVADILREFWDTIASFFVKPGIWGALLFMLFYRFPEAQLVKLIGPFLLDTHEAGGMSLGTEMVGFAYGTVGVTALIAGGISGGWLVSVYGLRRCLMPMAWSMSLTCLTFVYLSFATDSSLLMVNICVAIEQFGYGFGTTAYTLYLIHFAHGSRSTSHYAIATGIMALGMMLPGMVSGWIEEMVGYRTFFIYTSLCCIITIAVSAIVRHRIAPASRD